MNYRPQAALSKRTETILRRKGYGEEENSEAGN